MPNKNNNSNDLQQPALNPPVNPDPTQSMPSSWQCSVVLHPFSPPPPGDPTPDVPFFQLCTATITYVADEAMSVQITGSQYGGWWYMLTPAATYQNINGEWVEINIGWTMPGTQWLLDSTDVGSSSLNWMNAQITDWWKKPMPISSTLNATAWYWINESGDNIGMPFRMMFGAPPPSPTMGDPAELGFFQMFSFIYFTNYSYNVQIPQSWVDLPIPGFEFGNAQGYDLFVWNTNFGMTTFMTPCNEQYNPLPTEVLYVWKDDADYQVYTDRAQLTTMNYEDYNPGDQIDELLYMYGAAPNGVTPPPASGRAFAVDNFTDQPQVCNEVIVGGMPLGQEPPNWASVGGGQIMACISNNPDLCPNENIMVLNCIFPPTDEYPQGRYLWVWYSPFPDGTGGLHSRPVTFMESASQIGVGTSLALADYFDYQEFSQPIDPSVFDLPSTCSLTGKKAAKQSAASPAVSTFRSKATAKV